MAKLQIWVLSSAVLQGAVHGQARCGTYAQCTAGLTLLSCITQMS